MKISKKLPALLFLFCFLIVGHSFSQITIEENKIWTVIDNWFNVNISTTAYKFSGDTTINNIQYKKLLASYDSLLTSNWVQTNQFLREDSMHRIYRYKENDEEMLYDFTLEIGDTFGISYQQEPCQWVVNSIDSMELNNGTFRKKIELKRVDWPTQYPPVEFIYWIQGIGSLHSLTDYGGACYHDFSLELLCFMENGEYLYTSPNYNSCFITPVVEIALEEEISVYPNPTSGQLYIESQQQIEKVNLFDLSGKAILEQSNSLEIDLSGFNNGVYLLKIHFHNDEVLQQLVIKM